MAQRFCNVWRRGVKTLAERARISDTRMAEKIIENTKKNTNNNRTKEVGEITHTMPPAADAFRKREYTLEEIYIRNKEKEQRELEALRKAAEAEKREKKTGDDK